MDPTFNYCYFFFASITVVIKQLTVKKLRRQVLQIFCVTLGKSHNFSGVTHSPVKSPADFFWLMCHSYSSCFSIFRLQKPVLLCFTNKYETATLCKLLKLFCDEALYRAGNVHFLKVQWPADFRKRKKKTFNIEYSVIFDGKHVFYCTNKFFFIAVIRLCCGISVFLD